MRSEAFAAGEATTDFLGRHPSLVAPDADAAAEWQRDALAAVTLVLDDGRALAESQGLSDLGLLGWQSTLPMSTEVTLARGGVDATITVTPFGPSAYRAASGGRTLEFHEVRADGACVRASMGHLQINAKYTRHGEALWLDDGVVAAYVDRTYHPADKAVEGADGVVRAAMDGKIVRAAVAAGDAVAKGQVLVVVEAMKLELELTAQVEGTVEEVTVRAGDQVANGQVLVRIAPPVALGPPV